MSVNTKLRWLTHFITYTRRLQYRGKQNSLLMKLPLDILYEIIDQLHLDLSALILLSQSCSDLWYLLRFKCASAMRKASPTERLECLEVLAYHLPYHRLCSGCQALHIVDPKDVPKTSYFTTTYCKSRNTCGEPKSGWAKGPMTFYYHLEFRHVQLAIKYTRLRNVHQDYRARLLQRYAETENDWYDAAVTTTVEPVVVRGRFILMRTFLFRELDKPLSVEIFAQMCLRICPHLNIFENIYRPGGIIEAIRRVFDLAGSQRRVPLEVHSCDQCPTDYVVMLHGDQIRLQVWQDFGSGTSPTDPYWRSQIFASYDDPRFAYKHGSIRTLYYTYHGEPVR